MDAEFYFRWMKSWLLTSEKKNDSNAIFTQLFLNQFNALTCQLAGFVVFPLELM